MSNDWNKDTYLLRGASCLSRCGDCISVSLHLIVHVHADFSENLIVDLISLVISIRITHHFELVWHHLLLHAHLFSFHSELLHNLRHLLWVHSSIALLHDTVDSLEWLDHLCIHLRCSKLWLDRLHLTAHRVVHVHLLSWPDEILRHDLGGAVLVLLR